MNHIDKQIFKQPNVAKRLRSLSIWYWAFSVLGILCTVFYFLLDDSSSALSYFLLLGMVCGDLILLIVLCYYLFGDSRGPYSKVANSFLYREIDYYPASARQMLLDAFAQHDFGSISGIKRSSAPDVVLIRYTDNMHAVTYAQLFTTKDSKEEAISEIVQY